MRHEQLHRLWIRLRLSRWLAPALCAVPYLASILWLLLHSQPWMAALMLAPALLMTVVAGLTLALARLEFQGSLRRRRRRPGLSA